MASITRFASALTTNILNGASRRVPATGASDHLQFAAFGKIFDKRSRRAMAGDWFVAYGANHHWPCISFLGCDLVHAFEGELEIVALLAIEDR